MDTAVQLLLAVLSPMHRGGSHLAPSAASPVFQMVLGTGAIRALTPHSDSSKCLLCTVCDFHVPLQNTHWIFDTSLLWLHAFN
jgi:hypothetical protein